MNESPPSSPSGAGEPSATANAPVFKAVICAHCGKRMLIDVAGPPREHRCPVCKAAFRTTWTDSTLTVEFERD